MKTKKLLKREGVRHPVERASLEKLLERLAEKEAVLAEQLRGENDPGKAAKLERTIKLLQAQRKKGEQARAELG